MTQKNRNRRPMSTFLGCWNSLWKKAVVQKNRNRRPIAPRRILRLEALEDRTLLSGNVTAILNPTNGLLTINGDAGNNSISIGQSPIAGDIRVKGNLIIGSPPDVTKVNGVNYTDFTLSSVTKINITMLNGNDTVIMGKAGTGFSIPGSISINAGSGTDTFSMTGMGANTISINATGPGADSVTMSNTNAGAVSMVLGTGADSVSMDNSNNGTPGPKIGMLYIDTSASTANDSVSIANFPNVGTASRPVPGIGRLTVNSSGSGNNTINVTNSTFTNASLTSGTGTSNVLVSGISTLTYLSVTTGGGGTVKYGNSTASWANIKVGAGSATVVANNDTITGSGGLTVTVGTPSSTGQDKVSVSNDTVAGSMNVSVGTHGNTGLDNVMANNDSVAGSMNVNVFDDGPQYWSVLPLPLGTILPSSNLTMNNDTVGGALGISTGNFFRNVTVGSDNTANFVTAGSLSAVIGSGPTLTSNSEAVLFNTHVSGAEGITVGDFFSVQPPIPLLTPSTFTLNGNAGSLALSVGKNAAGGVSQNATVTGDVSMSVGINGGAVTMLRPTSGNSTVNIGDNSGAVTVSGNDDAGDADLTENITVGSNLSGPVTIQNGLKVSGIGTWTENVTIGDNDTINVNTTVPRGSETISSATGNGDNITVGSAAIDGNLTIDLPGNGDTVTVDPSTVSSLGIFTGNNATISVSNTTVTSSSILVGAGNGASVTLNNVTADNGSVNVGTGDDATISLEAVTTTGGDVNVDVGNSAASITLDNVTDDNGGVNVSAGDNTTQIAVTNSTASTMNINNGNGNTFIDLDGDNVGTGGATFGSGLNINTGNGNNTIELGGPNATDFVNVLGGLFVNCGSGINTVFAGNVQADFGTVNGGSGESNVYYDFGGNLGYTLEGFVDP